MNERSLTHEEQDALVDVIIHKIPTIKEAERLKLLVQQALDLLLRNPEDQGLRDALRQCARDIFVGLEFVPPSEARKARVRRTARDCVEVLRAAQEHRLPRDIELHRDDQGKDAPDSSANDNHHPAAAVHGPKSHPVAAHHHNNMVLLVVFLVVLLMGSLGGALIWQNFHADRGSIFTEAKSFTEQVMAVAAGGDDVKSSFGGTIKRRVVDGHISVIASQVPQRVCAASGWELVHKGTLTIDGVTPRRVSSAILTELCYNGGETVTLNWESRDLKVRPAPGGQR